MTSLPLDTHIGRVHLKVADLDRSIHFYENSMGFQLFSRDHNRAVLGAKQENPLLILRQLPDARPPGRTTGLYHFAILTPSRVDLANALVRLVQSGARLQGAADHGVSEALYLADPDNNGIEVYRDRPREEWPLDSEDRLAMVSDPIDLNQLINDRVADHKNKMHADTIIGHVHLHVAHIPESLEFYVGRLGFDLMQTYGPSAAFVSAGGYHHHLGLNTWNGVGAPQPGPAATGLEWFEVLLPERSARDAVVERLHTDNYEVLETEYGPVTKDPAGNQVLLSIRE